MPKVICPCGAKLNVPNEKMGTTATCPKCGEYVNLLPNADFRESPDVIYGKAYSAHYDEQDRRGAWQLYSDIIRRFPTSQEAEYARQQIDNIQREVDTHGVEILEPPLFASAPEVTLTTTPTIDGYRILKHHGIVSSEVVSGVGLWSELVMSVRDVFGGNSQEAQEILREMREKCLTVLKTEATAVGANAIVGVDLDYSEISGGKKSMLFLVATGTAVSIEPEVDELSED
jgi:uncharacterized protein YbjQ (UPF0145 family)